MQSLLSARSGSANSKNDSELSPIYTAQPRFTCRRRLRSPRLERAVNLTALDKPPPRPLASEGEQVVVGGNEGGIKQLTDQEFDRLLAAVLAEQQRRGRNHHVRPPANR
jgi:hypothetical protein